MSCTLRAERYDVYRPALLRDVAEIVRASRLPAFRAMDLLPALHKKYPWGEWLPGRPLTAKALSMILYPVQTEKVRVGDTCQQFYRRHDLLTEAEAHAHPPERSA